MQGKKILTILGTRPEAIKLAPVIAEFGRRPGQFNSRVCVTAQHREMLDQVLDLFEIRPHHDLGIMTPGQSLSQITARAVEGLDRVIREEAPDAVLVQGDTTTAFCGALAAFYHRISVGHVEAGLRTGNMHSPFPEEANRCLITRLTDFHFAPTERARRALIEERIPDRDVFVTGNTVIDALLWVRDLVRDNPPLLPEGLASSLDGHKVVLVTGHRRESFGEGFENICCAIRETADSFRDTVFVYPVHMNPNVRRPVQDILSGIPNVSLIEPLDYISLVQLMKKSLLILTDSGGIQEEAPSLGVPVLVMRETTERPEGVEAGVLKVVGSRKDRILNETKRLLTDQSAYDEMVKGGNPFGDGKAAKRIVSALLEYSHR